MLRSVIGNTSDFGSAESWFEPRWVNKLRSHFFRNRLKSRISGGFLFYRYSKCTPELLERGVLFETTFKIIEICNSGGAFNSIVQKLNFSKKIYINWNIDDLVKETLYTASFQILTSPEPGISPEVNLEYHQDFSWFDRIFPIHPHFQVLVRDHTFLL